MMTQRHETATTLGISLVVGLVIVLAIRFFSGMSSDHEEMLTYLQSQSERLEALEQNKAKATSKRWTSDDTMELIACLEIPYAQRSECLARITQRFNKE
jgi:hypothetical protein